MSKALRVSIVSISYNHEQYIEKALNGFLEQKTDFAYEIIIADDASTDKTQQTIKKYAREYPSLIKPILRQKNIGVQSNLNSAMMAATGDFIALCEGDDFWEDPTKLQRQVDFLDTHPDYSMCFHPVRVFFENNEHPDSIYPHFTSKSEFTSLELLRRNYIQTNSVMYRRQSYGKLPDNVLPLDWYYHIYHSRFGKIGFINRPMSAYRKHPSGLWWESSSNIDEIWKKHGIPHLELFVELLKLYPKDKARQAILNEHIGKMVMHLIETDQKYGTDLVEQATVRFPGAVAGVLASQFSDLVGTREAINNLKQQLVAKEAYALQLRQELDLITNSRSWKLIRAAKKAIKKPHGK